MAITIAGDSLLCDNIGNQCDFKTPKEGLHQAGSRFQTEIQAITSTV